MEVRGDGCLPMCALSLFPLQYFPCHHNLLQIPAFQTKCNGGSGMLSCLLVVETMLLCFKYLFEDGLPLADTGTGGCDAHLTCARPLAVTGVHATLKARAYYQCAWLVCYRQQLMPW